MGVVIIALEDTHEFHFDVVANAISNRALRARRDDQIIIQLGRTLFDGTDDILSGITRKPFVDRGHLGAKTLKFVDRHRSDLQK